jgi:hypothetical protein
VPAGSQAKPGLVLGPLDIPLSEGPENLLRR